MRLKGVLTVDAGCAAALADGGSLLAAGITAVEGDFARGDVVAIQDAAARAIAHGLAEYAAAECAALKGRRSAEHAEVLGYAPRAAVVHRDHMVLL
jgi:glutamate 5-kinase